MAPKGQTLGSNLITLISAFPQLKSFKQPEQKPTQHNRGNEHTHRWMRVWKRSSSKEQRENLVGSKQNMIVFAKKEKQKLQKNEQEGKV